MPQYRRKFSEKRIIWLCDCITSTQVGAHLFNSFVREINYAKYVCPEWSGQVEEVEHIGSIFRIYSGMESMAATKTARIAECE